MKKKVFKFNSTRDLSQWNICKKGPSAWDKYMGLEPVIIKTDDKEGCMRLKCIKKDGEYLTAGVKSKEVYGDGRLTVTARFHGGSSSWPAIWIKNYKSKEYYEIDLCEYFGTDDHCKTGIFMPKHVKWGLNRLFRPKKHPKINKDGWNTFTCEWDQDVIKIWVNRQLALTYWNLDNDPKEFPQTPEDRQFTIILSMQYGHSIKPKKDSQLPLWMDIKEVVWEPIATLSVAPPNNGRIADKRTSR